MVYNYITLKIEGDTLKIKCVILFIPVIVLSIFDYWFLFIKKEKTEVLVDNELVCTQNCKEGDKVLLKDGSSWHILKKENNKLILFSDATINLEGNFLSLDTFSNRNTGVPVSFDKQNIRTTDNNPYCIFQDLGCSAYEKNNIDVFEDSYIKQIVDSKFLPKISSVLGTDDIIVRLLKKEEFEYFKELEIKNNTKYKWLYYSGYWLMSAYNNYSVYVVKEEAEHLSVRAPYINHGYGIRPVIEVDYNMVLG